MHWGGYFIMTMLNLSDRKCHVVLDMLGKNSICAQVVSKKFFSFD